MFFITPIITLPQICHEVQSVEIPVMERQIERMKSLNNIEYWLWCYWINCWRPKYDCMWLVIWSLRYIGRRDWWYLYWEKFANQNKIGLHEWVRWDYLFMKNTSGERNHIAIITQPYDWQWYWILDTYEYKTRVSERYIKLYGRTYAWQYLITISRFE